VLITRTFVPKVSCDVLLLMRFGYKSHRWHYDYHESHPPRSQPLGGFTDPKEIRCGSFGSGSGLPEISRKGLRYPAAVVDD